MGTGRRSRRIHSRQVRTVRCFHSLQIRTVRCFHSLQLRMDSPPEPLSVYLLNQQLLNDALQLCTLVHANPNAAGGNEPQDIGCKDPEKRFSSKSNPRLNQHASRISTRKKIDETINFSRNATMYKYGYNMSFHPSRKCPQRSNLIVHAQI